MNRIMATGSILTARRQRLFDWIHTIFVCIYLSDWLWSSLSSFVEDFGRWNGPTERLHRTQTTSTFIVSNIVIAIVLCAVLPTGSSRLAKWVSSKGHSDQLDFPVSPIRSHSDP